MKIHIVVQSEPTLLARKLSQTPNDDFCEYEVLWAVPPGGGEHGVSAELGLYFFEFVQQIYWPALRSSNTSFDFIRAQIDTALSDLCHRFEGYGSVIFVNFTSDINFTSLGIGSASSSYTFWGLFRYAQSYLRTRAADLPIGKLIEPEYFWGGRHTTVSLEFFLRTQSLFDASRAEVFKHQLKHFSEELDQTDRVKCICLDLDDTIWGGVAGDVNSICELAIGGLSAGDRAFESIQLVLKEFVLHGIYLCVISKNTEQTVRSVFSEHPGMILKESDITLFELGFGSKAERILKVANRLNILPSSILFIDDSAVEREITQRQIPDLRVLPFGSGPVSALNALTSCPALKRSYVTEEDIRRVEQARRSISRSSYHSNDGAKIETICLSAVIDVCQVSPGDFERVFQLINKTNQFTTCGSRYTEQQIRKFAREPYHTIIAKVSDHYGSYGLTGILIARQDGTTWAITDLVISCRVFGRGVENKLLNFIRDNIFQDSKIRMLFKVTHKNSPAINFISSLNIHNLVLEEVT